MMKGPGVPCPVCYGATRVGETRPVKGDRHAIRRRRRCLVCKTRFTTVETPTGEVAHKNTILRRRIEFMDRFLALPPEAQAAVEGVVAAYAALAGEPAKAVLATTGSDGRANGHAATNGDTP